MSKFTHVVEIFLWDRPTWEMTEDYLRYRLDFFHKYTLKSLLNQSIKNFHIFVQLGNKYKKITEAYPWHRRVTRCYDYGREYYSRIKTQFLIISRLDSDDIFHEGAIKAIRKKMILHPRKRIVLVFKKNICYDMINNCIVPHRKSTSPFFTHIFPRRIYRRRWEIFSEQHFCEHGNHGAGDKEGIELPRNMVCVLKHGQNVSLLKRNLPPFKLSGQQKKQLKIMGKSDFNLPAYDEAIWDEDKIAEILKDFGVEYER